MSAGSRGGASPAPARHSRESSHWECAADGLDSRLRGNDQCFESEVAQTSVVEVCGSSHIDDQKPTTRRTLVVATSCYKGEGVSQERGKPRLHGGGG
jgi:hypothetical protein